MPLASRVKPKQSETNKLSYYESRQIPSRALSTQGHDREGGNTTTAWKRHTRA